MKDFFLSSVRTRLVLLFFLALVPIALLIGFNFLEQRQRALEQATAQAEVIFNLAVLNEQNTLLETRELLARLSEEPNVIRRGDCDAYLNALLNNYPRYTNFGVALPDGETICSAVPYRGTVNLGDRSYFRGAVENGTFSIGTYQVGRITGKPAINFGYPVFNANRDVVGVVFAALDPSYVAEFDTEIAGMSPAGSTFVKIDRAGTILTCYPESVIFPTGSPLKKSAFEKVSSEKKGTFTVTDPDGVERIYLFSTLWGALYGEESYVLLGMPMKALLAESERFLTRNFAFLAMVTLATIFLLWFVGQRLIVRPVSRIVTAAKRLASGDLSARADLQRGKGELGHLGLVFDDMAEELERKARNLSSVRTRLAHILAASPAVIYACEIPPADASDQRFTPVFLSEKIRELFGYEPHEVLGNLSWLEESVHPEDFRTATDRGELFRGGSVSREYRVRRKGGEYRWVLDQSVLGKDDEGIPREVVGSWTDISARRKAEETLVRLAMAVEQAAEAFIVTDPDGVAEYVNPAFERITGYSAGEMIGRNIRILNSGQQDERFYRDLWETISKGGVWKGRFVNRKKDGSFYDAEATISPVRNDSGNIVNYVSAKRDVTREVTLQKQVQIAQRMEAVGTLAGGIAHDFNNALTGIFGFTELALMEAAGNEDAVSNLNEIMRCAERAATLTRQLLAYSRRQIISPVNLDLNKVIADLIKLVSKIVGEQIAIRTDFEEHLPSVSADIGQIEQVLMNLFVNARDAMPSGGVLTIRTCVMDLDEEHVGRHPYMNVGRFVVLSVSDTGTGMDEATRERVFEPFFTTKGPDKGTGLGLAMVYGIIKQHKGFIHLESELGRGTTFRIYLPPVDAAPDVIESARPSETLRGAETVLLAEDDESVRTLVKRTLEDLGYTVLAAVSGEDAVAVFEGNRDRISLALLDVIMSAMGGKETYKVLSGMRPGLKVVFMSGYTESSIHESFVLLPGVPFLLKPFTPSELARKVREALDARE